MGVGFFLGILQPGKSLQLSRERAAASRFLPRLCPESGRLDQRRAPGTLRQPTRRTSCARSPAGNSRLSTPVPRARTAPCALPTAQLQPQLGESAATAAPALRDAAHRRPSEGLEGEGGAGKRAGPAPTGAAALPSRPPDSAPVASPTANGD